MWANTTLSSIFRPIATVTATATYRSNRAPFTVSAKHPRPQKNIKYDYEEETETETETETDRELELLNQRETEDPNAYAATSEKISGSAVLLALQKASAQKTSKKMKKKKMMMKSVNEDEDNRRKQGDVIEDYSDVKPLCIKSDWKDRLDDLEMQLHQLVHHT
ncbi:hypothetical protein HanXRQr2_Chr15g0693541 [Helianthus annuus]|uniref:Uncharacterized protein n=1 Tax=Helianthus annuus TaxID=4232 RepID=A0A9K3H334_HELAN|nr:uncharacterized protein LOC110865869 [Helianthus annuus]KAF5764561.1 hypothetical protein HanXRQr2_Chr15g0693541 [Helianthus annuus]KAJ0831294.1 hypothetical protein HanPSC8_Chr15g0665441 [Helianthus annuus]